MNLAALAGKTAMPRGMFGHRPDMPIFAQPTVSQPGANGDFGSGTQTQLPAPQPNQAKPGFFDSGGLGQKLAGVIGPAILAGSGHQGLAQTFINQGHQQRMAHAKALREQAAQQAEWSREDRHRSEDKAFDLNKPRYFQSGRDQLRYDPAAGVSSVIYDGPQDFENYAAALGFEPGTPEYTTAMQDYVLKSSGPTAYDYDIRLDDHRTANDIRLDGARTGNDIRRKAAPSYRDANPRPSRGGKGPPTARNAKGEVVHWNGRAWVPAK